MGKELLEILVWPAACLFFGVVMLIILRAPITRFIDRAKRVSREGIDTSNPQQQLEDSKRASAEELTQSLGGIVLQEQVEAIRQELRQGNLTEGPEAVDVLVRHLAATQIAYWCEQIYTYIYGSQISLLHYLNQNRTAGSTVDDLRTPFYEPAVTLYPDLYGAYTFEQYINFLTSRFLIRNDGGRLYITNFGVEFLRYVTDRGHPLKKMG